MRVVPATAGCMVARIMDQEFWTMALWEIWGWHRGKKNATPCMRICTVTIADLRIPPIGTVLPGPVPGRPHPPGLQHHGAPGGATGGHLLLPGTRLTLLPGHVIDGH